MQIQIRLFAALREAVGQSSIALTLPEATSVEQALAALQEQVPTLELPDGLALAVNQHYVAAAALLRDGDELALIPPVSGG